ncbi:hypothetical protein ONZ45_g6291 [Pleurotus djamor]|nr:hypothetical protein ONZ45_g6291 [Pleurotus djamor]
MPGPRTSVPNSASRCADDGLTHLVSILQESIDLCGIQDKQINDLLQTLFSPLYHTLVDAFEAPVLLADHRRDVSSSSIHYEETSLVTEKTVNTSLAGKRHYEAQASNASGTTLALNLAPYRRMVIPTFSPGPKDALPAENERKRRRGEATSPPTDAEAQHAGPSISPRDERRSVATGSEKTSSNRRCLVGTPVRKDLDSQHHPAPTPNHQLSERMSPSPSIAPGGIATQAPAGYERTAPRLAPFSPSFKASTGRAPMLPHDHLVRPSNPPSGYPPQSLIRSSQKGPPPSTTPSTTYHGQVPHSHYATLRATSDRVLTRPHPYNQGTVPAHLRSHGQFDTRLLRQSHSGASVQPTTHTYFNLSPQQQYIIQRMRFQQSQQAMTPSLLPQHILRPAQMLPQGSPQHRSQRINPGVPSLCARRVSLPSNANLPPRPALDLRTAEGGPLQSSRVG